MKSAADLEPAFALGRIITLVDHCVGNVDIDSNIYSTLRSTFYTDVRPAVAFVVNSTLRGAEERMVRIKRVKERPA